MNNGNYGWVKIHRSILQSEIFQLRGQNDKYDDRSAWMYILLKATAKDVTLKFNGKPITVEKGTFITSIVHLAKEWNWSRDKVRRYLDYLEINGMITRDSNNYRTLVTIVNWDKYQGSKSTDKSTDKSSDKTTDNTTDKSSDKTQTRSKKKEVKNIRSVKEAFATFNRDDPTDWTVKCLRTMPLNMLREFQDEQFKFIQKNGYPICAMPLIEKVIKEKEME